jgi:hypothetical protein
VNPHYENPSPKTSPTDSTLSINEPKSSPYKKKHMNSYRSPTRTSNEINSTLIQSLQKKTREFIHKNYKKQHCLELNPKPCPNPKKKP